MFYLANVFEFIIDGFDDRSFAKEYFVFELHQHILHIVSQAGDQVESIREEYLGECLWYIVFVGKEFSFQGLYKPLFFKWFLIIYVSLGDHQAK